MVQWKKVHLFQNLLIQGFYSLDFKGVKGSPQPVINGVMSPLLNGQKCMGNWGLQRLYVYLQPPY